MDDRNFLKELHSLKQQVNELSPKYKSTARYMAAQSARDRPYDDPFSAQLLDVNAQMSSMEDTIRELKRRLERPMEAAKVPVKASDDGELSAQRRLTLPSGPLFWQLFNSLRTDIRTIDGRVAALERSVSDLEDRMDGLEPAQFTPTSSAASSEVGCSQPLSERPAETSRAADYRLSMLPEPYNETNVSQGCFPIPTEQPYWQQPHVPTSTPNQPLVYSNMLHPYQELPYHQYEQSRLPSEASLRSDSATAASNVNRLHQQNDAIQYRIDKIDRENEAMLQAIRTLTQRLDRPLHYSERQHVQAELPSRSWPKPFEAPEVRFRDREIDRMDELLRATQERLRLTEESMAQKDASIAQLRFDRDEQRARESAERTNKLREHLAQVCDTLDAKNEELVDMREQLGHRNDALQQWQQSWHELSDSHRAADEQATSYKHAYYDSMVRADRDIQKLTRDHEEEATKLKEFCEQKDIVIQRQEDVIARGARLLEQRDGEIEDVSRQLRVATEDRMHAGRTQDRLSRLLNERDGEIERLKRELTFVNSEQRESKANVSDRNSITWDDSLPVRDNQSWTSPHMPEASRSDDRGEAKNDPWVQVGSSPLQFQKMPSGNHQRDEMTEDPQRIRKRSKRQRHAHRQYPEWNRQSGHAVGTWPRAETRGDMNPAPTAPGSFATTGNEALRACWGQMPAPVTARRMMSDANLHSRTFDKTSRNTPREFSKHHSMQELPRARLQAYVESEPESGGDLSR